MVSGLRRLSSARNTGSTGLHQRARRSGEMPSALCQQVLLGVDQIDQPPQARRGVLAEAHVDVDAAGGVGLRARLAQGADHLLDHPDVLPAAHRADHLGAGVVDRAVALDRPVPPVGQWAHASRPGGARCTGPSCRSVPQWPSPPVRGRDPWFQSRCRKSGFSRGFLPCARRFFPPAAAAPGRRSSPFPAATHSSLCAAEIATR